MGVVLAGRTILRIVLYALVGLVYSIVFHEAGHVVGAWLSGASVTGVGYTMSGLQSWFYVLVEPSTPLCTLLGPITGALCTVYLLWSDKIDNVATVVACTDTLLYTLLSLAYGAGDAHDLASMGLGWANIVVVGLCITIGIAAAKDVLEGIRCG